MKKSKRFLVVMAFVLCFPVSAVPARAADITDQMTNAFMMLVYGVAGPEVAYTLALNEETWDFLVESIMPSVSSVKEQLRQVALKQAPTLKPTATPPRPDIVGGKYLANSYTQVISFGDSMSDNGNMYEVGMQLANWGVPMPPNDGGRFSNGPVVMEIMSFTLNRPLLNYAFGGAMSGYDGLVPAYGFYIGVLTEVDDFIRNLGWKSADSRALYVIWTGPDDFYKGANIFDPVVVPIVTANIKRAMIKLYWRGARNFFVPLMPDLSVTPAATIHDSQVDGYLEAAHARSAELASSLTAMLKAFAKQYPMAKVRTFDTYSVLNTEIQKYEALGYNVTEACYTPLYMGLPGPVCDNPDHYLFWDQNHPTSWVSGLIGDAFAAAAVGAPLPSR